MKILSASFLLLASPLFAQAPRRPRGIYAVVNVEDEIAALQTADPSITAAQLDAGFNSFYQGLLSNPAVAWLALRPYWATLNSESAGSGEHVLLERSRRCVQPGGLVELGKSGAGAEDDSIDRAAGLSVSAMDIESTPELRRAVSDAGCNASQHVWNGELHRFLGGWQRRRAAAAGESGLQERVLPPQPNGTLVDMGVDNTPATGVSLNGTIYLGIKTGNIANGGNNGRFRSSFGDGQLRGGQHENLVGAPSSLSRSYHATSVC